MSQIKSKDIYDPRDVIEIGWNGVITYVCKQNQTPEQCETVKCPNCGATNRHNKKCDYCGT